MMGKYASRRDNGDNIPCDEVNLRGKRAAFARHTERHYLPTHGTAVNDMKLVDPSTSLRLVYPKLGEGLRASE